MEVHGRPRFVSLLFMIVVFVPLPGACDLSQKPVDDAGKPSRRSDSTVTFEFQGDLVAGSTLTTEAPLALVYTPAAPLKADSQIAFYFPTAVQEETDALWSIPTTEPRKPGYVRIGGAASDRVEIAQAERSRGGAGKIVLRTVRVVEAGEPIRVFMTGNVPRIVPRRPFRVWEVAPSGEIAELVPENVALPPVSPGPAMTLLLTTPSDLVVRQPIQLRVAALDAFGNVDTRFRGKVEFSGPFDGLPAVYEFTQSDAGLHAFTDIRPAATGLASIRARAELANGATEIASNPATVSASAGKYLHLFGDAHFHTGGDVESFAVPGGDHRGQFVASSDAFWFARNVAGLDWGATAEHDTGLSNESWLENQKHVEAMNDPPRFVSMIGYEWTPDRRTGHHVVIYEGGPSARNALVGAASGRRSSGVATLGDLATTLRFNLRRDNRVLLIPHIMQPFPNGDTERNGFDQPHETWDGPEGTRPGGYIFNDLRRVGEIYSHHNDDFTESDFRQTTSGRGQSTNQPQLFELGAGNPWSYEHAWVNGHRIGVIGGSDNHLGTPGLNDYAPTVEHHAGLAVVLAPELTRAAVFEALYQRRCYATTGPRMLVDFSVDGQPMGSEFFKKAGDIVSVSLSVHATAPLDLVEILKYENGGFHVLKAIPNPNGASSMSLAFQDRVDVPAIYYMRVRQNDREMAWTSPVWIDFAA